MSRPVFGAVVVAAAIGAIVLLKKFDPAGINSKFLGL